MYIIYYVYTVILNFKYLYEYWAVTLNNMIRRGIKNFLGHTVIHHNQHASFEYYWLCDYIGILIWIHFLTCIIDYK